MSLLQKDETLSASTEVHASAAQVYAVVSDVTRIPERSPETMRAEWMTLERFRAWTTGARLETRVAVGCLLNRLTNVTLLTDDDPHIHGQPFRSPTALPVTFDAK